MTSEIFNLDSATTTCTIVTGLTGPPEVTVSYDGVTPPLPIFMHLAALGFAGLTPQPPPVDAIDWATPDSTRGTTHTVRSYLAVSVGRYDGPTRDRDRAVDAVRLIFERLSSSTLTPASATLTPGLANGSLPLPPVAVTVNGSANGSPTNGRPVTVANDTMANGHDASAPASVPTPSAIGEAATDEPATVRAIVIDAGMAPALRSVLTAVGTVSEERPVTWTTEVRFRGSIGETHHRAVRFTVSVPQRKEDSLLDALAAFRLRSVDVLTAAGSGSA